MLALSPLHAKITYIMNVHHSAVSGMQRTQIYLEAAQQAELARLAQQKGSTSSALIREAIEGFLARQPLPGQMRLLRKQAAGAWAGHPTSFDLAALRQEERHF
jgi:predicted transcriptional regulator